ncbi:Oidioi.mRNA.OKI2018_I69.chr2.g4562.t1.cds [Oikopleura dioica]|uniref:Oidioi.mRNA.OKI2018_I69.chr2.g4562.t1.cds n=1 Tax=Oikopleura dioica TaxID=34765 RepID=A0ABN7SXG5_OIKDI|nr:Oidioi.mRNA.OKI2018_I69.chr2.g4562.t1.cds [Oikopleura dioica]
MEEAKENSGLLLRMKNNTEIRENQNKNTNQNQSSEEIEESQVDLEQICRDISIETILTHDDSSTIEIDEEEVPKNYDGLEMPQQKRPKTLETEAPPYD